MLSAVVDHLWQSTVFAAGVGMLTLMLRRNGASIRFALWLTASMKFLVPFALLAELGSHLPRQPPTLNPLNAGAHTLSTAIDSVTASISRVGHMIGTAHPLPANGPAWVNILGIVWVCGVLAIVVYWLAAWHRLQGARRASKPVAIDFPIPVRASSVMHEPAIAGIVRPILLVPQGIADWLSEEQLQAVLAHERCHVRRRDNLTAALHMIVEALFWFHPLVWWLQSRLVAERERACDEDVIAGGNKAAVYAQGILLVCQHYLQSPLRCAAGVSGGNLTRRIESILNPPRYVRVSAMQAILLAGIASVVVAEPIVSGHLAAPPERVQDNTTSIFGDYVAVPPADPGRSDGNDLLVAATNGNLAQVRSLLHKGVAVDFQERNGAGYTALIHAAESGHQPAVVQELLANGAQVEHRRNDGETALIAAGGAGDISIVEELLNAGAQVNDQDDLGLTALMTASEHGNQAAVLLLLSRGADVHRELKNGETALEMAARGGHDKVVRLLLDSGADFRHRRFTGETALDLAVEARQVAVVQTLLERGAGSKQ